MAASPPEAPATRFADLRVRILSGLAAAVVGLILVYLGGAWTMLVVAGAGGAMIWEYRSVTLHRGGVCGGDAIYPVSAVAGAAIVAEFWSPFSAVVWLAVGLLAGAISDGVGRGRRAVGWGLAGVLYIGAACIAFLYLRTDAPHGLATVIWLLLVVAAADVGGYFAGRALGGPKLWPRVSPGKTWSGLAGAIVLAVAVGVLFGAATPGTQFQQLGIVSAITALVSQAGDLAESALKRHFGIKDSGRLLPGHGGVMDRFDGLVAATLLAGAVTWWRGATILIW